jgi:hypothetical protein
MILTNNTERDIVFPGFTLRSGVNQLADDKLEGLARGAERALKKFLASGAVSEGAPPPPPPPVFNAPPPPVRQEPASGLPQDPDDALAVILASSESKDLERYILDQRPAVYATAVQRLREVNDLARAATPPPPPPITE